MGSGGRAGARVRMPLWARAGAKVQTRGCGQPSLVFNSPVSCLFRPFAPLLTGSCLLQLDYR